MSNALIQRCKAAKSIFSRRIVKYTVSLNNNSSPDARNVNNSAAPRESITVVGANASPKTAARCLLLNLPRHSCISCHRNANTAMVPIVAADAALQMLQTTTELPNVSSGGASLRIRQSATDAVTAMTSSKRPSSLPACAFNHVFDVALL